MDVNRIIAAVSQDLNDQESGNEFIQWPYDMLLLYLHEAVTQIAPYFKKYFTTQQVVEIEQGDIWQRACSCESVLDVLGEVTADGKQILRRLRRYGEDELVAVMWGDNNGGCPVSHRDYTMDGYVINDVDDSMFRVTPPVPRGDKKHYVLINCYSLPDINSLTDVPDMFVPMVKQWMLARAYAVDSENNPVIVQLSERHAQLFFKMLDSQKALAEQEKKDDVNSIRAIPDRPA